MMSRNCNNERMAMILQYVALGSMIIMAGVGRKPGSERRIRYARSPPQDGRSDEVRKLAFQDASGIGTQATYSHRQGPAATGSRPKPGTKHR